MLIIGDVIDDRYEIVSILGTGGGGSVYKAWDRRIRIYVAVKRISENVVGKMDVRAELNVLKGLKHPNLPIVTDFIEDRTGIYTVMDFVSGSDMKRLCESGTVYSEEEVCCFMIELCSAVDYLHTRVPPIIHSDIKPSNIMLTDDGSICLIDFNISSVQNNGRAETRGGTRGFAAPEQFRRIVDAPDQVEDFHEETRFLGSSVATSKQHAAFVDFKSDIYGIGATMFYLITGYVPKMGKVSVERFDLSSGVRKVIRTATDPDPSKRFSSAAQMRDEIQRALRKAKTAPLKRMETAPGATNNLRLAVLRKPVTNRALNVLMAAAVFISLSSIAAAICLIVLQQNDINIIDGSTVNDAPSVTEAVTETTDESVLTETVSESEAANEETQSFSETEAVTSETALSEKTVMQTTVSVTSATSAGTSADAAPAAVSSSETSKKAPPPAQNKPSSASSVSSAAAAVTAMTAAPAVTAPTVTQTVPTVTQTVPVTAGTSVSSAETAAPTTSVSQSSEATTQASATTPTSVSRPSFFTTTKSETTVTLHTQSTPAQTMVYRGTDYENADEGDIVRFGRYDWYVIEKGLDSYTLLMKNPLSDKRNFDGENGSNKWETSQLRSWLNSTFYDQFTAEEKAMINKTAVITQNYSKSGSTTTDDRIFLLSAEEANSLDTLILCGADNWWLRSPGTSSRKVQIVSLFHEKNDIIIDYEDKEINEKMYIRPAVSLRLITDS